MTFLLLAVSLAQSSAALKPIAADLRPGAVSFHEGIAARADAAAARQHFADAAKGFDQDWREGKRTRELALNRGRAHFLAGNLPEAVRAFRDGLALAPWDAALQAGLNHCRTKVAYPPAAKPEERLQPDSLTAIRHRVSPDDLAVASFGFSLCLVVCLGARLTVQPGWASPLALVGGAGLLLVIALGVKLELDAAAERTHPVLVVASDATLRTGNAASFDPRLAFPVPRGAEVRELHRRGGWVQVRLPGGAVGWLPEESVLRDSPARSAYDGVAVDRGGRTWRTSWSS